MRNAEEIFGSEAAYRAGTISGVQNRLAYGLVMKYFEKRKKTNPLPMFLNPKKGSSGWKQRITSTLVA